ncbi:MAG: hypothetical protein ABI335_06055 [Polyangiaceae bacterium]
MSLMVSEIQRALPERALLSLAERVAEYVGLELEQVTLALGPGGLAQFQFSDADAVVRALGYEPERDAWRELDAIQAREFLVYNTGHDLAYSTRPLRSQAECETLCSELLALIGRPARCFTRHSKLTPEQGTHSSNPIRRDWTFSEPYLFVGEERATLCTFLAED